MKVAFWKFMGCNVAMKKPLKEKGKGFCFNEP